MASEETTKGLVAAKLSSLPGYASVQNKKCNGTVWYKEDSYKETPDAWLQDVFANASKKQNMQGRGVPDFVVIEDGLELAVIVECKASTKSHSRFHDVREYEGVGFGSAGETEKFAVDGALYYASFLNENRDVVAIGVSGQNEIELCVSSFVVPKGGGKDEIKLLGTGGCEEIVSLEQYQLEIEKKLDRFAETRENIVKSLRKYTLACANFLRANGIEDNLKAGFVSAIILGLTNKESTLYLTTKTVIDAKNASKSKAVVKDLLGRKSVKYLKESLYGSSGDELDDDYVRGIWDLDELPRGKQKSLQKFYDVLLGKAELLYVPKEQKQYFRYGDTFLSACVYSLYENVVEVIEHYRGIDVMGEFYTTFLRFTKGNAKEKGIVLTPKHITNLFCVLAEYYSGQPLTENTKIIDTCCGTGAFLISALEKIKENIEGEPISELKKKERIQKACRGSLIGIESDESMYALAYANMRFHGDGKSNLFNCSSLLKDSYFPVDDRGKTYHLDNNKVSLAEVLRTFGDIDIGMINPPYSLGKADVKNMGLPKNFPEQLDEQSKKEIAIQKGQSELDFVASMLHYLKKGGIGIAIVPMSCAGNGGAKLRRELLKVHTLLASMTMPGQLFFDSHVGTSTCIMVFKAHIPHDESKSVFFGRWQEDGFRIVPHNGRKDAGGWPQILQRWQDQIDGSAKPDNRIYVKRKISIEDEALAEAYIETDYSKLSDTDFDRTLKKYALYLYMDENGLLEDDECNKLSWFLDHIDQGDFERKYEAAMCTARLRLDDRKWAEFLLGDERYFKIERGDSVYLKNMTEGEIPYISTTSENNGVTAYVSEQNRDGNLITLAYDGSIGACFYQRRPFFASEKIVTIDTVEQILNPYIAFFLIQIIKLEAGMYSYGGRKWTVEKQLKGTRVRLPVTESGTPDYAFMESYIRSRPFSGNIGVSYIRK